MSLKILIVDDQEDSVQSLSVLIKHWFPDSHVVCTYNGQDAIDAAEEIRPDIAFVDIMMPGKNGYQVAEELKHTDGMVIIAITALANDEYKYRGYDSGFHHYFVKPFDPERVHKIIKDTIRTKEVQGKRMETKMKKLEKMVY